MSDKEKHILKTIPEDKSIQLEISGKFYQRIQKLGIDFGQSVDKDTLLKAMVRIQRQETNKDSFAFNLETILILSKAVETEFEKGNLMVENEIEYDITPDMVEARDSMAKVAEEEKLKKGSQ